NLFAKDADDDTLWEALRTVELDQRISQGGGLDGWITQDTLSLGEAQRLNLARALLSDKPIVLFDEPAEHLDGKQGPRVVRRVLSRLTDRIVAVSSHHPLGIDGAATIRL
ncbi:MAG: ATP-binding cassette domain-containing protein, partial [Rhizobiaceae bacterium]|nr:ATP-binding cassette domain-containing protein [Rhizobiaceae bacterium]